MRFKYYNKPVTVNGIKYDSKREYQRHLVLLDAQRKGLISGLELQPTYVLIPAQYTTEIKHLKTKSKEVQRLVERGVSYTADFRYIKDGATVVEDVKVSKSIIPKEYVLKRKMLLFFHKIHIKEVYQPTETV